MSVSSYEITKQKHKILVQREYYLAHRAFSDVCVIHMTLGSCLYYYSFYYTSYCWWSASRSVRHGVEPPVRLSWPYFKSVESPLWRHDGPVSYHWTKFTCFCLSDTCPLCTWPLVCPGFVKQIMPYHCNLSCKDKFVTCKVACLTAAEFKPHTVCVSYVMTIFSVVILNCSCLLPA